MEILKEPDRGTDLRKKFESLWRHGDLCDVTFVSCDGVEMSAHFLYLAVLSPYFYQELSAFRRSPNRPTRAVIHIDAPSSIVQALIQFVYTGQLRVEQAHAEKLRQIASKLKFEDAVHLLRTSRFFRDESESTEVSRECETHSIDIDMIDESQSGHEIKLECSDVEYDDQDTSSLITNKYGSTHKETYNENIDTNMDGWCDQKSSKPTKRPSTSSSIRPSKRSTRSPKEEDDSNVEHSRRSTRVKKTAHESLRLDSDSDYDQMLDRRSTRVKKTTHDTLRLDSDSDYDEMLDTYFEDVEDESDYVTVKKTSRRQTRKNDRPCRTKTPSRKDISWRTKTRPRKDHPCKTKTPPRKDRPCRTKTQPKKISEKKPKKNIKERKPFRKCVKYGKIKSLKSVHKHLGIIYSQRLSRKMVVNSVIWKLTRQAFTVSGNHGNSGATEGGCRLWRCLGCPTSCRNYSKWRLHYRQNHLRFLTAKLSTVKREKREADKEKQPSPKVNTRKMPGVPSRVCPSELVKCVDCGSMLSSRDSLKNHLRQFHKMKREKLEQHPSLLVHCEAEGCEFTSIYKDKIRIHVQDCHPDFKYKCTHCQRSFVLKEQVTQHIERRHEKFLRFPCSECPERFTIRVQLRIHEQLVHRVAHNLTIMDCPEDGCSFQTTRPRFMESHRKANHVDTRVPCPYCNITLKTEMQRRLHVDAVHLNKRPNLCEVCGAHFADPWTLKRHIAFRHTTDRDYTCEHCNYGCNNRLQFMNHTFTQHGVRALGDERKELLCSECSYKVLSPARMASHMRNIHGNPEAFTCEVCGKGFKNAQNLRLHAGIHSGVRLHCPHCDYSPWDRSKLVKHIRSQHLFKDAKPYRCPYCDYACTQAGNCRKHVMHRHPGLEVRCDRDTELMARINSVKIDMPKPIPNM